MWELFKAELLRFRGWAIAATLLHALPLIFLTRVVDLAQQPLLVYRIFAGVYALAGLLLGLYQMGGYRRPNTWLNLLHRPVPHWQTAAALLAAGAVLLLLTVALPIFCMALSQETLTARVVDLRHFLLAPAALLIALCAYLAGAYCMLGARRYAAAVLVLPALIALAAASGWAAILLQLVILAGLAALVASVFKPDLSAAPRRLWAVVATALPLQMAVYLMLVLLCLGFEMLWIAQGSHPGNSKPPQGGFIEAQNAEGKDLMLAGLAQSNAEQTALWREQIALSEVYGLGPQFRALPLSGELTNIAPMEFDDTQRGLRWVFSHDDMRFWAYDLAERRPAGKLGIGADHAPFPTPPLPAGTVAALPEGDSILLASHALYRYVSAEQSIVPRIVLPDSETFAAAPEIIGDSLAVLSDRALYFFDGRDVLEDDRVLTPRLRVATPGDIGSLTRIDMIELVDGYLISFAFTRNAWHGALTPYQETLKVADDGAVGPIARRALGTDFPDAYRYRSWWLSPAMAALYDAATLWSVAAYPLERATPEPKPRGVIVLAGVLSLLSLLGSLALTGRIEMTLGARLAWIAVAALVGLPALLSLWLIYPERTRQTLWSAQQPAAA